MIALAAGMHIDLTSRRADVAPEGQGGDDLGGDDLGVLLEVVARVAQHARSFARSAANARRER